MFNFFKRIIKSKNDDNELKKLISAIHNKVNYVYSANDLSRIEEYENLKKLSEEEQKVLINKLTDIICCFSIKFAESKGRNSFNSDDINYFGRPIAFAIQSGLLRRKLNYNEHEWIELLRSFKDSSDKISRNNNGYFHDFPINHAIKQIEYYLKNNERSKTLTSFINEALEWEEFKNTSNKQYFGSDMGKATKKLRALLVKEGNIPVFSLKTNDIGNEVNEIINSVKENRDAIDQIFYLASNVTSSKPSKKFSQEVAKLQDKIGLESFKKIAHRVLETPLNHNPFNESTTHEYNGQVYNYVETVFLCNPSQQFIKGMVWTVERFCDKETIRILSKLCEKTYLKIPGKGPAAASIGNACVYVLGNMRGKDGLGALSLLKLKIRQNNVKKTIDNHLTEGAKKYNVSVEELKEMAVPDFNLVKGEKIIQFDGYSLKIFIEGRKVSQQWLKPDGLPIKSVPSLVKKSTSLSKKLSDIRQEIKEIQKVYSAQKQRIDNQFILDRTWDFVSFEKYYLEHGLVAPIAEKLIWIFTKGNMVADAITLNGKWYSKEHKSINWIDEETTVKLWHPVYSDEETIIAWREKMMELEWKQPIKQAFREIYILTDAEVNTLTYSNRMAAHILKQHQFSSLANLRGWKYSLLGAFDDGRDNEICEKYLPEFKITAQFWIDELSQDESWNDTGIWLYISTDQVKFTKENGEVMELVDVPKIIFTEIMRDVDMFVGVGSVGNDPQWMDNNGERQTNRDYWTSYSFGDLTEIAKTRKAILERLLPRLKKIRDKAEIDGKFLMIKGQLRTYKIHIGSGNILMEPNDQYLCIVPSRSAENSTDKVFIPFEGDRGLSIVLSKALLLAEDNKITDSTIMSQINRS
tara:strand:+ start:20294 stop:22882 length:2589 start_codon:yes stop_codon:yes gene_type:complete